MASLHVWLMFSMIILATGFSAAIPARSESTLVTSGCYYGTNGQCSRSHGKIQVRTIRCMNGGVVTICCAMPYPAEVVKSRKNWLENAVEIGTTVSSSCTKRVLCLQACENGWKFAASGEYPEILLGHSVLHRQFLEAYMYGETIECYQPGWRYENGTVGGRSPVCERMCGEEFSECDQDMKNSLPAEYLYKSSRIFHELDLWFFSAFSSSKHFMVTRTRPLMCQHRALAVQFSFEILSGRMNILDQKYTKWAETEMFTNVKTPGQMFILNQELEHHEVPALWDRFLEIQGAYDMQWIEGIHGSLNYVLFRHYMNIVKETVMSYDFSSANFTCIRDRLQDSEL